METSIKWGWVRVPCPSCHTDVALTNEQRFTHPPSVVTESTPLPVLSLTCGACHVAFTAAVMPREAVADPTKSRTPPTP